MLADGVRVGAGGRYVHWRWRSTLPPSIQPSMPADPELHQPDAGVQHLLDHAVAASPHQTIASAASGASTTVPPPAVTASARPWR